LERNCQLESIHSSSVETDDNLLLSFGETNCTVTLKNCVPGVCYSFLDLTYRLDQDGISRQQPSSFFKSVSVAGAAKVSHTAKGVAFESEGKEVQLTYSTHTCSDFYWYHGRETSQLCRAPYEAITTVEAGTPYSLSC